MRDFSVTKTAARPTALRRPARPNGASTEFRIVLVCRANLCRSPMAEFLMRRYIEAHKLPVRVSSAGTHAKPGMPMHPLARRALASMQIEAPHFVTRPLTATIIERSDLILTMTDTQRSWVVDTFPQAVQRTYLLSQFSQLVEAGSVDKPPTRADWGASLIHRAMDGRAMTQPLTEGRDIQDPIGRSIRKFQACVRQIDQRLSPLFDQMAG